jgi:Phage integrase family
LTTVYAAGLRVSEVVLRKISDIDSGRMMIREQGKGGKDRYVMLSPQLLRILRSYWRFTRPKRWLFPGTAVNEDAGWFEHVGVDTLCCQKTLQPEPAWASPPLARNCRDYSECVQLKANGVGGERPARQPRPLRTAAAGQPRRAAGASFRAPIVRPVCRKDCSECGIDF